MHLQIIFDRLSAKSDGIAFKSIMNLLLFIYPITGVEAFLNFFDNAFGEVFTIKY